MIPWFEPLTWKLGPLEISAFGLLAAAGILVGSRSFERDAKRLGIDAEPFAAALPWMLLGGAIGGHLVHLLLYHPEELARGPLQLLKVWDGLSSMGGLVGALIAGVVALRRRGSSLTAISPALAVALPLGWGIARVGCFTVHDHPGALSDSLLAVAFPGGARHDLGLDEALALFVIAAVGRMVQGRLAQPLAVTALLYGAARFSLDFLRARDLSYVDARYLGLTPAQYVALALVAWGAVTLGRELAARRHAAV